MISNPLKVAVQAKGIKSVFHRGQEIIQRYGITSRRMDRAISQLSEILEQYHCGATLPITAVTLSRHPTTIKKYSSKNIEFAVHGYTHIDYTNLSSEEQKLHLERARQIFIHEGLKPAGFRSPYLTRDEKLDSAIKGAGFEYTSNQPILWNEIAPVITDPSKAESYQRALAFYKPWLAGEKLSLPWMNDQLVEIPVALPDDEILIDRLDGDKELVTGTWLKILSLTQDRGELFTLQLHPERAAFCADGLATVLARARSLKPIVWCASMGEIADWWRRRAGASIEIDRINANEYSCTIHGPIESTSLIRAVEVNVPSSPWFTEYREVKEKSFLLKSARRPIIGISTSTPKILAQFLQQQGYCIEISENDDGYACFINKPDFQSAQERSIFDEIERSNCPIVRLNAWPDGARSALCVTGDIDALTIWDYGLRAIGR